MNGLSSTALQNVTSLAQPIEPSAAVRSATCLIVCPISATASMLMPARVEATLTEAQTRRVSASACGTAADEVDADGGCGPVERPRDLHDAVAIERAGYKRDRRHRDAVVDDRNAELAGDFLAYPPQIAGDPRHPIVNPLANPAGAVAGAIEQADADGDGADVEPLEPDHVDGLENLLGREIGVCHGGARPKSGASL